VIELMDELLREETYEEALEARAAEWAFRLDHALVDDDTWRTYCAAQYDSWAQERDAVIPEPSAEIAEKLARMSERRSELRAMPYAEYLRTAEWQRRRHLARVRAGQRCQVCNGTERLEVHHRTYERRGAERDDDLFVLCERCHGHYHERGRIARHGSAR
jgi:hypothetical protein